MATIQPIAARQRRLTWLASAVLDTFQLPEAPPYTQMLAIGCPDDFHAIRVGLPNRNNTPYEITRIVACPSTTWSDYVNPTGSGTWATLRFSNRGLDCDGITTSTDAPESMTVAANEVDSGSGETTIPKWTWSDWSPIGSLPRSDQPQGPRIIMLRMALPQNQVITYAKSGFAGYTGVRELNHGFDFATAKWPADVTGVTEHLKAESATVGHGVNSVACVQFLTTNLGVTGIITGDSHQAGTSTTTELLNYYLRATVELGAQLIGRIPLGYVTCATGGAKSQQFFPRLLTLLPAVRPGYVLLPGWTFNDTHEGEHAGQEACDVFFARLLQAADTCIAHGAMPIFTTPFPRNPEAMSDKRLIPWLRLRNAILGLRTSGSIVLDSTAALGNITNGRLDGRYIPELSNDKVHPNDLGHQALAAQLGPILRTVIGV